ncbi:hypothetical protein [Enterobacter mori]|uniref:hypothetical protein n=1 Tax=Enterobacter mori TaxID=539813 RepID=UPI0020331A89|nr:hypothetical protein [Enterobacter mori]
MKLKILIFPLLAVSVNAFSSDILRCEYAKSDLREGANAPMIPGGMARIEFDGTTFKATRPNGSFVTSPLLALANNGMLMVDDKTKVFAANQQKTEFAVSDRIAKTTEQWANCKPDTAVAQLNKVDKEIAEVQKLSGSKAKSYFMNEKHAFLTNCMVWDDVTMITGKAPAMVIAGSIHMGTNPRWDGKEYSFKFNGGSMIARFTPSEPKHKLLIQAGDKFYGCGPSTVDHTFDD